MELGGHLLLCHHVHIQIALLHNAERCYVFAQTGNTVQVRSNALLEVGGSPTWTLTEDYALGMELKKYGWHCRYVQEYLAIGEAPDQIRNCYQQRSRWCKARPPYLHSHAHTSHSHQQSVDPVLHGLAAQALCLQNHLEVEQCGRQTGLGTTWQRAASHGAAAHGPWSALRS